MGEWSVISRIAIGFSIVAASIVASPAPGSAFAIVPNTPVDLGLDVVLAPIATIPDNSFGTAPRLNAMATTGDRIFVVEERDGLVYELVGDGDEATVDGVATQRTATLYLDVAAAMSAAGTPLDTSSLFHGGLRSIAFHPDFASNGLLYASAMVVRPIDPSQHHYLSDVADPIAADSVLLEFTADRSTGIVDHATMREVFRVGMPVYDHPIKQIAFDRSLEPTDPGFGLLFVGHGDASVLSALAGGGQGNDALGKVLRIDPRQDGSAPYRVPGDNPFVGDPTMIDEVFSIGHRNPHSLAFATLDGQRRVIVADAGRDNVEEINVVSPGGDFGWPQREGTFVHLSDGGFQTGIDPLPANDAVNRFTYPAVQYGHDGNPGDQVTGEAVTGGFAVENGSDLDGQYFFADFPTSGRLFHSTLDALAGAVTLLDPVVPDRDEPNDLTQADFGIPTIHFDHDADPTSPPLVRASLLDVFNDASTYETSRADVRFGQGPGGELYITSKRNNTVYLVVNSVAPIDPPDDPPTDPPDDPPTDPPGDGPPPAPTTIATASSVDELVNATDYEVSDARILRLYRAFFDREPELDGARFWLETARNGRAIDDIARFFATSPEFNATYGQVDDPEFLEIIYANVLDRAFDQAGFDWWLDQMTNESMPRERVVLLFSDSPEFIGLYPYLPDPAA